MCGGGSRALFVMEDEAAADTTDAGGGAQSADQAKESTSTGESAEQTAAPTGHPGASPMGPRLNMPRKFERRHKLSVRTERSESSIPLGSPTGSAPAHSFKAHKARTKTRPPRQEYHYPFK